MKNQALKGGDPRGYNRPEVSPRGEKTLGGVFSYPTRSGLGTWKKRHVVPKKERKRSILADPTPPPKAVVRLIKVIIGWESGEGGSYQRSQFKRWLCRADVMGEFRPSHDLTIDPSKPQRFGWFRVVASDAAMLAARRSAWYVTEEDVISSRPPRLQGGLATERDFARGEKISDISLD